MKKLIIAIILLTVCSVHGQIDEKETLKQLNQKVLVLYQSQKFDEALKLARQAIDLSLKIYGAEGAETAEVYRNLGVMYQETEKYKQSVENLQNAVNIYQKMSDTKHKELVLAYQILAYSQFLDKQTKEAEKNYLKAVEIAANKFGKESKETFSPLMYLANFYARNKDTEKADDLYLKGYFLAKKYFGEKSEEFESVSIYRCYYSESVQGNSVNIYRRYYSEKIRGKSKDKNREFGRLFAEIAGYELGEAVSIGQPYPLTYSAGRLKDGKVIVKVWIDETGNVKGAKAVYGYLKYALTFETAARKSKFNPTIKDGKSISAINFITYNFVYNAF